MQKNLRRSLALRVASFLAIVSIGTLAAVLATLPACYPNSPDNIEELDIVVTFYDENEDFGANKNYAMPDSIFHFIGADSVPISRDQDSLILATVQRNMTDLNYTRVAAAQQADVVLLVAATATKNYQGWVSYPWWPGWGWWPGWSGSYPGYGWYWPWAPVVSVYTYKVGTLVIDMVHAQPDTTDMQLRGVWNAALQGVMEGSPQSLADRVTSGIDQAFNQSPYLRSR